MADPISAPVPAADQEQGPWSQFQSPTPNQPVQVAPTEEQGPWSQFQAPQQAEHKDEIPTPAPSAPATGEAVGTVFGLGKSAYDLNKYRQSGWGIKPDESPYGVQKYLNKQLRATSIPRGTVSLEDLGKATSMDVRSMNEVQDALKAIRGTPGVEVPITEMVQGVPVVTGTRMVGGTPPIDISQYVKLSELEKRAPKAAQFLEKYEKPITAVTKRVGIPAVAGVSAAEAQAAFNRAHEGRTGLAALDAAGAIGAPIAAAKFLPKKLRILGGLTAAVAPATEAVREGIEGHAAGGAIQNFAPGGLALAEDIAKGFLRSTPKKPNELVGTRFKTTDLGGLMEQTPFDPNKYLGAKIIHRPYDLSSRNQLIEEVSGHKLINPIKTEGGQGFGRDIENQAIGLGGASNSGINERILKRVDAAAKEGSGQVLNIPSSMGFGSEAFSMMPISIQLDLLKQRELSPAQLEELSNQVRAFDPKKFSNFVGFGDPRLETQLLEGGFGLGTTPGKLRIAATDRLGLKNPKSINNQQLLDYNIEDLYHAIRDPDLRNTPPGYMGLTVMEAQPFTEGFDFGRHSAYNAGDASKYIGRGTNAPISLWMPDTYKEQLARMKAEDPSASLNLLRARARNVLGTQESGVAQTMTPQVVDNLGRYQEAVESEKLDPNNLDEIHQYIYGKKADQYAPGGSVIKAAKELILPAAENASRTQIIGTLPTYAKAADILAQRGAKGQAIDFGAGLGKGAAALGEDTHTYEPFAKDWTPTFTKPEDIPTDAYGRLTNLNVLNVVPREARDEIVQHIGRVMEPGGLGILTTRGADVMGAKGVAGPEPMSIITSRDTYQKGFTKQELEDYMKYMLGDKFDVNKLNLGPAGVMIQKKAAGGEILKKLLPLAEREGNLAKFLEGTKAVDAQGKPLTVYHGTSVDEDFDTFKKKPRWIHVTEHPDVANSYTQLGNDQLAWGQSPRVLPLHLNTKNPLILDEDQLTEGSFLPFKQRQREWIDLAKQQGNDSIYNPQTNTWMVPEPNQLKSTIGNQGTFDPNSRSLTKKKGGIVKKK